MKDTVGISLISCLRANCQDAVYLWHDPARLGSWIQHGENKEARRFFHNYDFVIGMPVRAIEEWLDSIHAHLSQKES